MESAPDRPSEFGTITEQDALRTPALQGTVPAPPADGPRSGVVLRDDVVAAGGEYKLLRRLGSGTFGDVYEAEAPGGVRVAVKLILWDLDHPASQSELASLEAIKRVSHPFLLQTQAFWTRGNRLVIVMELADGTLADRVTVYRKQGLPGVPPAELIPFFVQASEALDFLHSQNISHRDIKPENLLHLKGYAKVADFGLARVHAHTQTVVKQMTGTPLYMAPEVWGNRVSLHSDQYSLAATYVAARLGRPLFEALALIDLALEHRDKTPDLEPLPPAEQRVLRKALAKKPDDRYPNCSAFAAALREAVLPPPPSGAAAVPALPPAPPPHWSRRAAIGVAVSAGLLAAAAAVAVGLRPAVWCPPGWEPVAEAGRSALPDGKTYYNQLARTVGGERLVAMAVPPTNPTDPPLFYMLRDKVTNRVFEAAWGQASGAVTTARRNFGPHGDYLLPGKWKDADRLKKTGIAQLVPAAPVVNVTLPEAALVAEALGGVVPKYAQWEKAIGCRDDAARKSSAGSQTPDSGQLALDLTDGPWPVDRPTADVSVYGIHQLASNGYEWTREERNGQVVNPFVLPSQLPWVLVVGRSWDIPEVLTFATITQGGDKRTFRYDDAENGIGFRVVFEPK